VLSQDDGTSSRDRRVISIVPTAGLSSARFLTLEDAIDTPRSTCRRRGAEVWFAGWPVWFT
jgi:hypothetical protein